MGMFSDDERPQRGPESISEAMSRRDEETAGWPHPKGTDGEFAFPTNVAAKSGVLELRLHTGAEIKEH